MNDVCIEPRAGRELELAYYAGGDLAPEAAERVEEHLAACAACRSLVEGLRESQAGLAALAAEPLDPEALARVRHAVSRRIEEEEAARRAPAIPRWVLPLAAGLVLALLAAAVWLRSFPHGGGTKSPAPDRVAAAPDRAPPPAPGASGPEAPAVPPREEPAVAAPEPTPPVRQAAVPRPSDRTPVPPTPEAPAIHATEPMVIQVVSDDPDIVFYWLVEPEETEDATVSS